MSSLIFYIKALAFLFWIGFSSLACFILCFFRWKDTNLNRTYGHMLAWGLQPISGIRVEVEGLEHLEKYQPCIYAANHHSELDLFTFASFYPRHAIVIGKKELAWIPFFGLYYMAAGNVMIDRKKRVQSIAGLNEAVKAVTENKDSLWIFPEGTRNRGKELLLPFKKGAFYMAKAANVPIVPIVAEPIDRLLSIKHRRMVPGTLRAKVLPPVYPADAGGDVNELLRLVRESMVEALRGLAASPKADSSSLN
jgi:1-acyl-sn-glycerol-3-phosphate acyltransferase